MKEMQRAFEKEWYREQLAERLKSLRESAGLSHEKVAKELDRMGVKKGGRFSLMNYEKSGESTALGMSVETLLGLADLYGVSTDYILGKTDDPAPVCAISPVDELGLSRESLQALTENDWWWQQEKADTGEKVRLPVAGLSISAILSRLLEDSEFLKVLGNLSSMTTPAHRKAMHKYDATDCPSEYPEDGLKLNPLMHPFKDSIWDMEISNAARHFGNAAERVLKDYDDE